MLGYSAKLHYLGRVGGLAELADALGAGAGSGGVPLRAARLLADAVRARMPDRILVER